MLPSRRHLGDMDWSARLGALERQGLGLGLAVAVGLAARRWTALTDEALLLLGWLVYCAVQLAVVWRLATELDAAGTRRRAQTIDPGAAALFVLVAVAACASVVAIAFAVDSSKDLHGWAHAAQIALAMAALAASWLLIQAFFALRYARDFYAAAEGDAPAGGLAFPGGRAPDVLDFLYFSAVIGMTSQVSDVTTASRAMRRLVLAHGLLAFAFNLVVLALAVNVVAGSFGR
jgi:uncharacterized membrane protein